MRLKELTLAASFVAAGALIGAGAASSQTLGFGTSAPGAWTHSAGSAVAKLVSEDTGMQVLVQPQGVEPMPNVNANLRQLCIANAADFSFSVRSAGYHEGEPARTNLREIGVLTPLLGAIFARKDSDIRTMADLKGKRVPSGFGAQKSIKLAITAHLANAGLGWDDVQQVPAPTVPRSADDFGAGKTDMFYFALGSAKVMQVGAGVGGLRVIPLDDSPAALARVTDLVPGAFITTVQPRKGMEGVEEPTKVMAQNMVLVTNDKVADEVVYKITKSVYNGEKQLKATFIGLGRFAQDRMTIPVKGTEFHPGAIKFYKEVGQWPPKAN